MGPNISRLNFYSFIRFSKINIMHVMRNTWNFPISINILVKAILGFSALEWLFSDFLCSMVNKWSNFHGFM